MRKDIGAPRRSTMSTSFRQAKVEGEDGKSAAEVAGMGVLGNGFITSARRTDIRKKSL